MNKQEISPLYNTFEKAVIKDNILDFGQTTPYMELELARFFVSKNNIVLSVFPTLYTALNAYEQLDEDDSILFFGADEFISAQLLSASPELLLQRILTMDKIVNMSQKQGKIWLITHVAAVTRPIMSQDAWIQNTLKLNVGDDLPRIPFIEQLVNVGYERVAVVEKMGEFAVRGEIIDIYSPNYQAPIRLSFFDTEIDVIFAFDVLTQITTHRLEKVAILPVIDQLPTSQVSIISYLKDAILLEHQHERIVATYDHMLQDAMQFTEKNEELVAKEKADLFIPYEDVKGTMRDVLTCSQMSTGNILMRAVELAPKSGKNQKLLQQEIELYTQKAYQLLLLIGDRSVDEAKKALQKQFPFIDVEQVIYRADQGFNELWETAETIVVNFRDVIDNPGTKLDKKSKVFNQIDVEAQVKEIDDINQGDYVVHVQHGIARYDGVKTITAQNVEKDYMVLSYAKDETVYVPVEKVDLLYKYTAGKEGYTPKRSELGNKTWKKRTERVQEHVDAFAQELFQIYIERERIKGYQFSADTERQKAFEADFAFTETADQLEAIAEIKKDMQSPYIMERLLCGDVGFGKTEVAFRAAFKAMDDGKQVVMLAPTTILAKQHFENAQKRFKDYGFKIGMLSRLVTKKEQEKTLFELEIGEMQLVIGTHRVLSKDVVFDDLGLVIIDEEHRFGVEAKERFKKFRTEVDVLLVSATPIPRTLQMSVTGIRDLSLLQTAPHNRYPVQTYVVEQNENLIKDAIERELSRGGQTYFLYNKVKSIEYMTGKIEKLLPDARIAYAHGQMPKNQLEDIINGFVDKEIDVLISTTIIENGMDIPNANTLIIYEADLLGLAQLYQLRGRVGRSDRIAYSYFMYNGRNMLTEEAVKRLQTVQSFTEFGSGYHIAMRDLAIRGAGDVLGKTQSGFINDVGFDLYIDMLQSAIARQQQPAEKNSIFERLEQVNTEVTIAVPAYIPSEYVMDESVKIEIYQKLNSITSYESMIETEQYLVNRFGKIPEPLLVLHYIFLLRKTGEALGVQYIRQVRNKVMIRFKKRFSLKLNRLLVNQSIRQAGYIVEIQYQSDILNLSVTTMRKDAAVWLEELWDVLKIVNNSVK